jgi:hypothetical protein
VKRPRRTHRPPHAPRVLGALAAIAAVVLLLGLPRLLIRCTTGDGDVRIEFAHAEGTCCAHDHAPVDGSATGAATPARGASAPSAAPHAPCEHEELGIELAPPARNGVVPVPPCADGAVVPWAAPAPRAVPRATRAPPATGPPRPDARAHLRASTLLLL